MSGSSIRWNVVGNVALAAWFVTISIMRVLFLATGEPATDLRLYLRGSAAWLNGQDPWLVHMGTLHYAAVPPSLLLMAPFALLPEAVGVVLLTALGSRGLVLGAPQAGPAVVVDRLAAAGRQPVERQPADLPRASAARVGGVPGSDRQGVCRRPVAHPVALEDARVDRPGRARDHPDPAWPAFFDHLSTTTGFLTDQSKGG